MEEFLIEEFLIAADLLESNSFADPAKYLRDAARPETGSTFELEAGLPPLLVEAARIYSNRITLAKLTLVVFLVQNDHETRSVSFVLRAGTYCAKGLIGRNVIDDVRREGTTYSGTINRFLQLIEGLNLQERLLEFTEYWNE